MRRETAAVLRRSYHQRPTSGVTLNVTVIVIEQLEWGGRLRTMTFAPRDGLDFWIARLDEYDDTRSVPFHVLDRDQERQLAREFRRSRTRMAAGYKELDGGLAQFRTEWRGISTSLSGLSCYAVALPRGALPEQVLFTDPHVPDREYRYRAVFDQRKGRVVCYLECRSKLGSFDFDLLVKFHRDPEGCAAFTAHEGGNYTPDLADLKRMAAWEPQDGVRIQQFFDSSTTINAGDHSIIVSQAGIHGPIVGEVSGTVGAIGTGAQGEVELDLNEVFSIHRAQLRDELVALLQASRDDALLQTELTLALNAVDDGEVNATLAALRRVGIHGLHLARELGVNLAAAVIAGQIGLGL